MTVDTHGLSPSRTALGLATLFGGAALTAGAVIGVAAGVGAVWHATNPPGAAPAAAAAAPGGASSTIKLVVENVKTPDGQEPAFVGPNGPGAKVLFQLHVGTATTVSIVNKSGQPHTFSSSALGLDVTVPPGGGTAHFTVDPKQAGTATWDCSVPCGAWVMAQAGYMTGQVQVLS